MCRPRGLRANARRNRVVADDGPGIPSGIETSAFERFSRGEEAHASGRSGAGLGLSIVQAIVQAIVTAHGGTVTVGRTARRWAEPR